ncbi:histidine phosphatase family protein [Chthonobacter albigriseus]|uniref:histidine phosphatase family protein n=1 Tax=Chthonobacter albigriseus TaxID=1683161 RepID=UPI0015EE4B1C|nr:histidine phosphatase family protein [Chthonobacter albigriseus]
MNTVVFVTHPEVAVDPSIPVPRWQLSPAGLARMRIFVAGEVCAAVRTVVASTECKAIEAAGLLAGRLGLPVSVHEGLGENDRSATGFVPPAEFEALADAFFARPEESVRGWERAIDAQARVVAAVDAVLAAAGPGDVAIVAHGAVGTLLGCHLAARPIDRRHDQPFQGHYFAFERDTRRPIHDWRPIAPR